MDFDFTFSPEHEAFRKEVRAFLDEHGVMPKNLGTVPNEIEDMTPEQFAWGKEFRSKLGARGWYFPTWPKEYGGGGLSSTHDLVLQEELAQHEIPEVGGLARLSAPGLMVWGTEEQKERFLKPLISGQTINWQLWTEPDVGSDLAAVKTRAIRDGDYFVVNGTKTFISGNYGPPDYFWMLAITDPDAPRHRNLGAFFFPGNLPGITIQKLDMLIRGSQNTVYLENVRVPAEYMIGGDNQGWQVMQATAEVEHGGGGAIAERDKLTPALVEYARSKNLSHAGKQALLNVYLSAKAKRLIEVRTYWMGQNQKDMTYEGSQNSLTGKQHTWKTGMGTLEMAGPYALLNDKEFGPLEGRMELAQRNSESTHAGGSPEIQKVIIARRIGLSRTKERVGATYVGSGGDSASK
jgi:alkylation response protein AidB-like acyl-CoA dehydrogenase